MTRSIISLIAKPILFLCLFGLLAPAQAATSFSFSDPVTVTPGSGGDSGSVGTTARWVNIGSINGTVLDLEISINSNNRTGDSNSVTFSTDGDDAAVFLRGTTNQTVNLSYSFYETGTSNAVVVIPTGLFKDLDTIESVSIKKTRWPTTYSSRTRQRS